MTFYNIFATELQRILPIPAIHIPFLRYSVTEERLFLCIQDHAFKLRIYCTEIKWLWELFNLTPMTKLPSWTCYLGIFLPGGIKH